MSKTFGNTWWGSQWLRSLDHIDYENRIPRGVAYARKGNVKSIKINQNIITAKVAGSMPRPYNVTIIVPPFFDEDIERLMQEIEKRPALISKLMNRELDPEMMDIAQKLGLVLFPRQWTDFKMQCSCPDWAVPCKHLAAVIYMVSQEIDNNPFLVFEMHRVNLVDELKKRNISVESGLQSGCIGFYDLIVKQKRGKSYVYDTETAYEKLDFTKIQPLSTSLVQLLPNEPPFDQKGNFRDKYQNQLSKVVKQVRRVFSKDLSMDVLFSNASLKPFSNRTQFSLGLKEDMDWTIRHVIIGNKDSNPTIYSQEELLMALSTLTPEAISNVQPSVAALHNALFFAFHLLANGAVIPQIVQLPGKDFKIRWLPAQMDVQVQTLLKQFDESLPPELLMAKPKGRKLDVALQNQAEWLVSLFLNFIIRSLSYQVKDNDLLSFFFLHEARAFDGVGEKSTSGAIKVWLDRYYLTERLFCPVLLVQEQPKSGFALTISIEFKERMDVPPVSLSDILTQTVYEESRFRILRELSLLAHFIPGWDAYINRKGIDYIPFTNKEFAPFLLEVIPAIRMLNIKVMLPKSLAQLLRPKATVKLKRKNTDGKGFLSLNDLLAFDWQIVIGDQILDPETFSKLTDNAMGLIKYKGRYVYMDEAGTQKIYKLLSNSKPLSGIDLLQTALSEEYESTPVILTKEVQDLIRELTSDTEVPLPVKLNANLRPYQVRGFSWLYRNMQIGFGSILADDMGLGKTLQVLAFLLKLKEESLLSKKERALVVVPTGLLTNWQMEVQRFAPSLSLFQYHGPARDLNAFEADVLITTYGVLRSDSGLLKKKKWRVLIIDEAQNIKNHDTAQSKAIKEIPADIHVAMSGTPVENRLTEFWSIMDFANKGYLGNVKHFKEAYANPIQLYNDEQSVRKFRKITAPFMMRRLKSDKSIISDLPDKIEQNEYTYMTATQTALYQKTLESAMAEIEGIESTDHQSLFKRQGLVLQMILALKQICNHPSQFLKNGRFEASQSGKSELLLDLMETILERNEKVLIFTQFKEMGDILVRMLEDQTGEKPMFYHGGCSLKERQEMIDRFQNNRADKVFVLSLKAAGTGLNLTAASHVIHYDLWWNPAVESQATDRAYRIGQSKNVFVHRCITKDTFEERIDEMIQSKKNLADMTISTGENWIGKLSNQELREIFG